jgi:hypothetical protein
MECMPGMCVEAINSKLGKVFTASRCTCMRRRREKGREAEGKCRYSCVTRQLLAFRASLGA